MAKKYDVTRALNYLTGALGKPYRWAAAGPNAYDCSGLTMRAFAAAGYSMPHQSMAQYIQTRRYQIPATDSPPAGCLVFFGTAGIVTHVGTSIGGGQGIFAPHTGADVEKESIAAVRSSFSFYAVTNPLGVTDTEGLTKGEDAYAKKAGGGHVPALLGLFLAALRWQESGSPHGNYTEPNGQGAYQIVPDSWQAATRKYGVGTRYPTASSAPPAVQDEVAAARVTDIYYGAGEKSWRITARVWNGGTPNSVPNPALGPGATTNTYASQVLAKMAKINPAELSSSTAGQATADSSGGCVHQVSIDLKITSAHICMDKPLALVSIAGGTLLMGAGVAVLLVATLGRNKAVAAAVNAVPAGRALTIAKSLTPAERTAKGQRASSEEARRTAPARAAERSSAAESRRAEAHAQRLAQSRTRHRRAGAAASQRRRHAEDNHDDRMAARSSARVMARTPRGRSMPGPGHEPFSRTARKPAPALPDEPPF